MLAIYGPPRSQGGIIGVWRLTAESHHGHAPPAARRAAVRARHSVSADTRHGRSNADEAAPLSNTHEAGAGVAGGDLEPGAGRAPAPPPALSPNTSSTVADKEGPRSAQSGGRPRATAGCRRAPARPPAAGPRPAQRGGRPQAALQARHQAGASKKKTETEEQSDCSSSQLIHEFTQLWCQKIEQKDCTSKTSNCGKT